jgi:hypothetical protein
MVEPILDTVDEELVPLCVAFGNCFVETLIPKGIFTSLFMNPNALIMEFLSSLPGILLDFT